MLSQVNARENLSERIVSNLISSCARDAGEIEAIYSLLGSAPKTYLTIIPRRAGP